MFDSIQVAFIDNMLCNPKENWLMLAKFYFEIVIYLDQNFNKTVEYLTIDGWPDINKQLEPYRLMMVQGVK